VINVNTELHMENWQNKERNEEEKGGGLEEIRNGRKEC
jgi:hypothetical protein